MTLGPFRRYLVTASAAVLLLLVTACGYHTNGAAVRLPTDLHTIYVPAFTNPTLAYQVQQVFTAAVVQELRSRTNYRIVSSNDDNSADAILQGTITSFYIAPLTYDSTTGRISSSIVVITMVASLTTKEGKTLWSNPNFLYREQYQESIDQASFFEEAAPATQRVANSFAKTLVANILESY